MKLVGYCYEQGVTDGNLSGFAAQQIFHHKAHTVHLLKNQYHENMEVKVDEIQSEKLDQVIHRPSGHDHAGGR